MIIHKDNGPPISTQESKVSAKDIPKVFARIYTQPGASIGASDDPFSSSSDTIPDNVSPKKSRIPKPAQDLGHVRKDGSPSSSPSRSPRPSPSTPTRGARKQLLRKRTSILSVLPAGDAGTLRRNSLRSSDAPETVNHSVAEDDQKQPSTMIPEETRSQANDDLKQYMALKEIAIPQAPQHLPPPPPRTSTDGERPTSAAGLEVAPMRPLLAYSAESLRRIRIQDEPPVAQHLSARVLSTEVNTNSNPQNTTSLTRNAFEGLERTGSVNSAMAAEINRLRRLLEQKEKEARETRRSQEISRDLKEDDTAANGSPRKGTLANELRMSKKEAAEWKKRAEWAESRLLGVGREVLDAKVASPKSSRKTSRAATSQDGSAVVERPKNWFHE